jgi:hypothetical protein
MKIVHISTSDLGGGAQRAAYRLHTGLRRLGRDSSMFVPKRHSDYPSVVAFEPPMDLASRIRRRLRRAQIKSSFARCGKYTVQCGACPQLGSNDTSDLSYQIWKRKRNVFERLGPDRMHIVAPSSWMANEAKRSTFIVELLRQPEKRVEMAANCRRIAVKEYSLEVQARRYTELYETLLAQNLRLIASDSGQLDTSSFVNT